MRATRMATASARSTSTRWRARGPCCAPGSARTAASRRRSCRCISASSRSCTTSGAAAKPSLAPSSQPWWCDVPPSPRIPIRATDEYDIYARLPAWGYTHKTVCHARGEYARDEDDDAFCEVHVNTMEGFWSLLRSWLRPHRGISQDKPPLYLGFFQFAHNARRRGKALLGALVGGLVG